MLQIGSVVTINTPPREENGIRSGNPYLHGKKGIVVALTTYGAILQTNIGSGYYRAHISEMIVDGKPHYKANSNGVSPQQQGYSGDICNICQSSKMIRRGTCLQCQECFASTGCD